MSMMSVQQLAKIADVMNLMRFQPDAVIAYDLMSDALYWSDEVPPLGDMRPRDFWCLRPVLRYRTCIIIGKPESEWEDYWLEAKKCFPSWAGFHPTRCSEDQAFASSYYQRKANSMAEDDQS